MASTVKQLLMEKDEFFLPHDITFNILKRLTVKSLLRFRCVCKDWNDLFKSSLFIKEHLHHSIHHRGPSLLLRWDHSRFNRLYYGLLDSDKETLIPLNPPSVYHPFHLVHHIIGSSHGLVCLQFQNDRSLFLWNPATGELQYVPKSKNKLYSVGFGFSRVVNDYKIVRIIFNLKSVEVYSLSIGSWKEVGFGNLDVGFILCLTTFTATDEAIYWLAYTDIDVCTFILSFDTAKEVFGLIPMPASSCFLGDKCLIAHENKLALLSNFELWVMEGGGSGLSLAHLLHSTYVL